MRHGESKWNQARKERNYRKLIHVDHILTYEGIKQSRQLRKKTESNYETEDPDLEDFLNADRILCSPLTRVTFHVPLRIFTFNFHQAVQTCLLALEEHPAMIKNGIKLCRDLREIKNLGGFDAQGT